MVGHVVSIADHQVALSTWDSLVAGLVVNTCPSVMGSVVLGLGICKLYFLGFSASWLFLEVHWMEIKRQEWREISVDVTAAEGE